MKKTILLILVLTVALHVSLFALCVPILNYAEGWTTFYWDRHYLSYALFQYGVGEVVRQFFLQYFAHPITGILMTMIVALLVAVLAMVIIRLFCKKTGWMYLSLIPSWLASVGLLALISPSGLSALTARFTPAGQQQTQYIEMSNMVRKQDWNGIIARCDEGGRVTNLLTQNFLNMALAEKGVLGQRLYDEPCIDIRSIYIDAIQNEDFAVLLSDIYYSMGHIAQSQRYAFELNEKKNDFSPRLLMRLVQTNIIYGQYAVAEKYIRWLEKTVYYQTWAASQRRFLYHDDAVAKDAEYGVKRRCLIADNRFSGIKGLDDDLLHIARQTRGTVQCRTTLQYLGALYLLAHYNQQFVSLCDEFPEYQLTQQKYFADAYKKLKGGNRE